MIDPFHSPTDAATLSPTPKSSPREGKGGVEGRQLPYPSQERQGYYSTSMDPVGVPFCLFP